MCLQQGSILEQQSVSCGCFLRGGINSDRFIVKYTYAVYISMYSPKSRQQQKTLLLNIFPFFQTVLQLHFSKTPCRQYTTYTAFLAEINPSLWQIYQINIHNVLTQKNSFQMYIDKSCKNIPSCWEPNYCLHRGLEDPKTLICDLRN